MIRSLIALSVLALTGCALLSTPQADEDFFQQSPQELPTSVLIKDRLVFVDLAVTPEEHAKGLAGATELDDDEGMLFLFKGSAEKSFWMKGMVMPIDIIWIRGGVAGITKNVPAPLDPTNESELTLYASPGPVDGVLEVRAGFADEYDIETGDTVVYE